jgi:amino acid transporter
VREIVRVLAREPMTAITGRNLPIGIVGTLLIATLLYCSLSLVMCGMVQYQKVRTHACSSDAYHETRARVCVCVRVWYV